VSWSVHAGTSRANAVAESNISGTAAASGVLAVGRDALDAFASDIAGSVHFGVVADVAGAWVRLDPAGRLAKGEEASMISELSEGLYVPPRPVDVNSDIVMSLWLIVYNVFFPADAARKVRVVKNEKHNQLGTSSVSCEVLRDETKQDI